jgi:steroid delta-isomerase-like uncharacterized protein
MRPEETVERYWRAWSEHNLAHLLALLAPEFVLRSPLCQGRPADRDGFANLFRVSDKAFPNLKVTVSSAFAGGDRVACETVETATFTGLLELLTGPVVPSQRPYSLPVASFFRVDAAGLLVAQRSYFDAAVWAQQLGVDASLLAPPRPPSYSAAAAKPMTRFRKRLQVAFEGKEGAGLGFTENVSATGMLVHSNFVCAAGTSLHGKIQLPGGGEVRFEAQVRWARRAEGAFAGLKKSSMGVRFVTPPEERFYQLLVKPVDR